MSEELNNINQLQQAALDYADNGWRVHPLVPGKKVPLLKHWLQRASRDVNEIGKYWADSPEANIGVVTGKKSGIVVVDIDGPAGEASLQLLNDKHGDLETLMCQSPNGRHLYFQAPKMKMTNKVGIKAGIDVRAEGGYIIAPPSQVNGKTYIWLNQLDPAPMPAWLIKSLTSTPSESWESQQSSPLQGVSKGKRNDTVFRFAAFLRNKHHLPKMLAQPLVLQMAANCSPSLPKAEAIQCIESAYKYAQQQPNPTSGLSAAELMSKEIEPPKWVIPGLLASGLSILAGRPKAGKSWLALDVALSCALGRPALAKMDVEQTTVLYLALEDPEWRLQKRVGSLLAGESAPNNLHLYTHWPKLNNGGLDEFEKWMQLHTDTGFIIIDTLAKIRSESKKNGNLYMEDYQLIAGFKQFADSHNIPVLLVHHLRKQKASDPFEQISGTYGINGAADTMLVLDNFGKQATLHVTGRDVEESAKSLEFDQCRWKITGNFEQPPTKEQAALLEDMSSDQWAAADLATKLGKAVKTISRSLQRMAEKGLVIRTSHGVYMRHDVFMDHNL